MENPYRDELSMIEEHNSKYVRLLNELCKAAMTENNHAGIGRILSDLTDHSEIYHEFEESLMEKIDYPHYDNHIVEHEKLRSILKYTLQSLYQMDTHTILTTLLNIKNDSMSHVFYTDLPLIKYYEEE